MNSLVVGGRKAQRDNNAKLIRDSIKTISGMKHILIISKFSIASDFWEIL
jgi:hypothetical protein